MKQEMSRIVCDGWELARMWSQYIHICKYTYTFKVVGLNSAQFTTLLVEEPTVEWDENTITMLWLGMSLISLSCCLSQKFTIRLLTTSAPHLGRVNLKQLITCEIKVISNCFCNRQWQGLTNSHHVVPAIQQARAELQPLGGVAHVDQGHLPISVLADGGRPGHQEPADDEQDDGQ